MMLRLWWHIANCVYLHAPDWCRVEWWGDLDRHDSRLGIGRHLVGPAVPDAWDKAVPR